MTEPMIATDLGADWAPARLPSDVMTAVTFREFGGPEVLRVETVPLPHLCADEVLVQVRAVSVGRLLDLAARAGTHPYARFDFPHVLGAEHSGVVAAVGADVRDLEIGQRVATFPVLSCGSCLQCSQGRTELCSSLQIIGTHRQGAYAEYVAVPSRNVHIVPEGLRPVEACAIALGAATAMNQLTRAGAQPGDWVVVQAATSALGSVTAALAAHLGTRVIATSRSAEKRAQLTSLGFSTVLDGTSRDFVQEVLAITGGRGANVVVDNVGDAVLWRNSQGALGAGGVLVSSGAFVGRHVEIDLQRLYSSGQTVLGVRTGDDASCRRAWDAVRAGFRPPLSATFPLHAAADAHRYLEQDMNVGRVTLTVGG